MNSTALGGPSSRVVRGLLAAKRRSPSDCAPSAERSGGDQRARVRRHGARHRGRREQGETGREHTLRPKRSPSAAAVVISTVDTTSASSPRSRAATAVRKSVHRWLVVITSSDTGDGKNGTARHVG